MVKKIIIGNWKMNPRTVKEAVKIFSDVALVVKNLKKISTVICAPSVFLDALGRLKLKSLLLGAENCFFDEVGPYTGEVSSVQLRNLGVRYVILGHSERRALGENDELISKKIKSVVVAGLYPVLCVGESLRDENCEYLNFLRDELLGSLSLLGKESLKSIVVAYEPLWAIGKKAIRPATPEDVHQVVLFLKKVLAEKFGREVGLKVPIVYGGSVDGKNAEAMLRSPGVDGLLVGRESLNAEKFAEIASIANAV